MRQRRNPDVIVRVPCFFKGRRRELGRIRITHEEGTRPERPDAENLFRQGLPRGAFSGRGRGGTG